MPLVTEFEGVKKFVVDGWKVVVSSTSGDESPPGWTAGLHPLLKALLDLMRLGGDGVKSTFAVMVIRSNGSDGGNAGAEKVARSLLKLVSSPDVLTAWSAARLLKCVLLSGSKTSAGGGDGVDTRAARIIDETRQRLWFGLESKQSSEAAENLLKRAVEISDARAFDGAAPLPATAREPRLAVIFDCLCLLSTSHACAGYLLGAGAMKDGGKEIAEIAAGQATTVLAKSSASASSSASEPSKKTADVQRRKSGISPPKPTQAESRQRR